MGRVSTFNIVGIVISCICFVLGVRMTHPTILALLQTQLKLLVPVSVPLVGIIYFSIAINKERKTVQQEEA